MKGIPDPVIIGSAIDFQDQPIGHAAPARKQGTAR
jgi:hypothetical protein